jgi:hypothetical protein
LIEFEVITIPIIWMIFSVYLFWYITSANYNVLITRKDAKTLWKIHKSNRNCSALKWKTLKNKKGKIIGYACHCGYQYCQKKPILSRIPRDSSQKITYNPTILVRI